MFVLLIYQLVLLVGFLFCVALRIDNEHKQGLLENHSSAYYNGPAIPVLGLIEQLPPINASLITYAYIVSQCMIITYYC